MFKPTRFAGKLSSIRLSVVLLACVTPWLLLQGAWAEDSMEPTGESEPAADGAESLRLQEKLRKVQADLQTLQANYAGAQVECEHRLAKAGERIESLEAMLEEVQSNALAYRAESAERLGGMWELYDRLLDLGAAKSEQGLRLSLPQEELVFRFGATDLPQGEMPSLDEIADLLADHPEWSALVEGHTDSAGPAATNLALSQERADAVRQALIDRGVAAERVTAEGIGEARPIATNATGEGRRQNRRVEIYLMR